MAGCNHQSPTWRYWKNLPNKYWFDQSPFPERIVNIKIFKETCMRINRLSRLNSECGEIAHPWCFAIKTLQVQMPKMQGFIKKMHHQKKLGKWHKFPHTQTTWTMEMSLKNLRFISKRTTTETSFKNFTVINLTWLPNVPPGGNFQTPENHGSSQ